MRSTADTSGETSSAGCGGGNGCAGLTCCAADASPSIETVQKNERAKNETDRIEQILKAEPDGVGLILLILVALRKIHKPDSTGIEGENLARSTGGNLVSITLRW